MTTNPTLIDLTPAAATITVIEGEPHTLRMPLTDGGVAVDIEADYPDLLSRIKIGDAAVVEWAPTVENTNVLVVVIPALTTGDTVYWELRDNAADATWLTARIVAKRDQVPQ